MNNDSLNLSPLFEKTLIRITASFGSDLSDKAIASEISRETKRRVKANDTESGFTISRGENGIITLVTPFLLYRDSRLFTINLLKWIERRGYTGKNDDLVLDLKIEDTIPGPFKGTLFNTSTKIEDIDKLKFIVSFDEDRIYNTFPSRKNEYNSQTIKRFIPVQKFIPEEGKIINPRSYDMPDTEYSGVNFETLNQGFLRLQYIGGTRYETKVNDILSIMNDFVVTSWNCVKNKGFTRDEITKFQKIVKKVELARESYRDYAMFKRNFPKVNLSVDLMSDKKLIDTYYSNLRDRLFDIFTNIEFEGELDINYDSAFRVFQIKEAKLKVRKADSIEFVQCQIERGNFSNSAFYDCEIIDSILKECNIYKGSVCSRSLLINSFANRTTEIRSCEISGPNSILNAKMFGGVFRQGKIGEFAEFDKDVVVVSYQRLRTGYQVYGDRVIIPTKKYGRK